MPIAMAASSSSSSCFALLLLHSNHHSNNNSKLLRISSVRNGGQISPLGFDFDRSPLLRAPTRNGSHNHRLNKELVFRMNAAAGPEDKARSAAVSFLASFSISSIPELLQNPWVPGIAGLLVGTTIPFVIEKLLQLADRIDSAAEAVEKVADKVVEVAEEVEKKAEELEKSLPEGGLRKMVSLVEDLAEETAENAQKVSDMMDKVDEMTDTLQDKFEDEPRVPQTQPQRATSRMGFSQTQSNTTDSQQPQCEICRFLRFFDF